MPVFDPQTLATDCRGEWTRLPEAAITGFAIDSRRLQPGDLFVAITTERRDGHEFLDAAQRAGAAAALVASRRDNLDLPQLVVEDPLAAFQEIARAHRRRFSGKVVGVTGSAGKTSTKDILAVILGDADTVLATEGNLNNHLGVPLTLTRLERDIHRFAVIEAGISGPGEMDVVASMIQPDVAIITMVAAAHLDRLGSVAGVSQEKARLAGHLRSGGIAVFPVECLQFSAFRELAGPALVTVRATEMAGDVPEWVHLVPVAAQQREHATEICVTWDGAIEEFAMRRTTFGMAGNAALAIATALHLGRSAGEIRRRLPLWKPAWLRGTLTEVDGRPVYLDCYNANPASMADALEGFLGMVPADAPRLYVVGCMEELGTDAEQMHRRTGAHWPLRGEDRMVVLGTHAQALAGGARESAPNARVLVNPGRDEVREMVRTFPGPVFLKGSRRYELETLINGLGDQTEENRETAA